MPLALAPALVALDARVKVVGPNPADETLMPLEVLYRTPKSEHESEFLLEPNQFISQVILPHPEGAKTRPTKCGTAAGRSIR